MEIKSVTVKYGLTHSMGYYSNIRPEVILEAELGPSEDVDLVISKLERIARERVEKMIDDALGVRGESPFFYEGPRYYLYANFREKKAMLASKEAEVPPGWELSSPYGGLRLGTAIDKLYGAAYRNYDVFDCSSGDFSEIPVFGDFCLMFNNARSSKRPTMYVVAPEDCNVPDGWAASYAEGSSRIKESYLAEIEDKSKKNGVLFFDATDGDFSKIPGFSIDEESGSPCVDVINYNDEIPF